MYASGQLCSALGLALHGRVLTGINSLHEAMCHHGDSFYDCRKLRRVVV